MAGKDDTGDDMRKALLVTTASLGLIAGLALPANAADTTTTFALTAGGLSVTAPTSADLGSGVIGGTIATQLGAVTVDDTRGALVAAWTATAVSTAFTTGTATAAETIAATNVEYWSGAATASSGASVATPGQATSANAVVIDTAKTAFSLSAGTGNNSSTWNPTVEINVPATAVAGTYTGTITHSVA